MESTRQDLLRSSSNLDNENKPVLRLESLDDFERVPAALRAEICKKLGVTSWDEENFDIRIISDDEKYVKHYIRRVQAINAGAQFLIDTLCPLDQDLKEKLNAIAAHCSEHLNLIENEDIRHYQNSLFNYCDVITDSLADALDLPPEKIRKLLDRSEQYAAISTPRPSICTISHLSGLLNPSDLVAQIDIPLNPFTPQLLEELRNIKSGTDEKPQWFTCLDESEQQLMLRFLATHTLDTFGTAINSISSKLRVIPAPANYAEHTLITFHQLKDSELFIIETHHPEFRSSHVASRDISKKNASIRRTHAYNNLKKEIEDAIKKHITEQLTMLSPNSDQEHVIPILYQTLITPLTDRISPDSALNDDRLAAVAEIFEELNSRPRQPGEPNISFVLISTNHPLNYGKYINPTTSWGRDTSTGESIETLIFLMRNQPGENQRLQPLLDALETHTMRIWSNEPYRELYLCSLEQLVVSECDGISIGSCVSGKDRKAVEIAHTDALKLYYSIYHSIPPLTANNRQEQTQMDNFARIFADIYCTKHQMALAELNAPGSFGVKTPAMYLPDHLKKAIATWYQEHRLEHPSYQAATQKDMSKESDIMASNNEVSHIKFREFPPEQISLAWDASCFAIREDAPLTHYLNMALFGAQSYLMNRDSRLGFFARVSQDESGLFRAHVCENIFNDSSLSDFQKTIFLYALLSSRLGENMLADITTLLKDSGMKDPVTSLYRYLVLHAKENGIADPGSITNVMFHIHEQLGSLHDESQIASCIETCKALLGEQPSSKLQPE